MNGNAIELTVFAANNQPNYRHLVSCYQNLERKKKRGIYDSELAAKLFEYAATDAAKAYVKAYCGAGTIWHDVFSVDDRKRAAILFRDEFEAEIAAGNSWLN
jgi:hypothetical protein